MTFFRCFIFWVTLVTYLPFTAQAEEDSLSSNMTKETSAEKATTEKKADKKTAIEKTQKRLIQPVKAIQQLHNDDLKHYTENAESLLVGIDEYITISQSSNTVNNKGVIILIPDWQQPATNPRAIHHIQTIMPNYGWATITVQPMDKPKNYPSTAIDKETQKEENQKAQETHQKKLAAIYQAIMGKVKNMPGIFILVSEGNHAGMLMNILSEEEELPHAMVLLSSYSVIHENHLTIAENIANSDVPILDLYLKKDNNQVKRAAILRKKQTNQAMKAEYRQRQLNNFNAGYYPKERLIKEIKGWLKSIGW